MVIFICECSRRIMVNDWHQARQAGWRIRLTKIKCPVCHVAKKILTVEQKALRLARQRALRMDRKILGLCFYCPSPAIKGTHMCVDHSKKNRERRDNDDRYVERIKARIAYRNKNGIPQDWPANKHWRKP